MNASPKIASEGQSHPPKHRIIHSHLTGPLRSEETKQQLEVKQDVISLRTEFLKGRIPVLLTARVDLEGSTQSSFRPLPSLCPFSQEGTSCSVKLSSVFRT